MAFIVVEDEVSDSAVKNLSSGPFECDEWRPSCCDAYMVEFNVTHATVRFHFHVGELAEVRKICVDFAVCGCDERSFWSRSGVGMHNSVIRR